MSETPILPQQTNAEEVKKLSKDEGKKASKTYGKRTCIHEDCKHTWDLKKPWDASKKWKKCPKCRRGQEKTEGKKTAKK